MVVVENGHRRCQFTHQGQSLGRVGQRDGEIFARFLDEIIQNPNHDRRRCGAPGKSQHTRLGGIILGYLGGAILHRVSHGSLRNQASRTVNNKDHLANTFPNLKRPLVEAGGTFVVNDHDLDRGPAAQINTLGFTGKFNGERLIAFSQFIIQQADSDHGLPATRLKV